MLRLRLSEGVSEAELRRRYGVGFEIFGGPMLAPMRGGGLLTLAGGRLSLTRRGMLVSNSVIAELLAMIS
jgi:oxygen-independent coproporphyrinogen-3 oxidase